MEKQEGCGTGSQNGKAKYFSVAFTTSQIAKIWSLSIFKCPFKKQWCKWFCISYTHTHLLLQKTKSLVLEAFFIFFRRVMLWNPKQLFLRSIWEFLHLSLSFQIIHLKSLPVYCRKLPLQNWPKFWFPVRIRKLSSIVASFFILDWITFNCFQKVNLPSKDETLPTQTIYKQMYELHSISIEYLPTTLPSVMLDTRDIRWIDNLSSYC